MFLYSLKKAPCWWLEADIKSRGPVLCIMTTKRLVQELTRYKRACFVDLEFDSLARPT